MRESHIETWSDLETGDLCFQGRLRTADWPQLDSVDGMCCEKEPKSAADVLLALEILFRRGEEQHRRMPRDTADIVASQGACISEAQIAAPASPQLPKQTLSGVAKRLGITLLYAYRPNWRK